MVFNFKTNFSRTELNLYRVLVCVFLTLLIGGAVKGYLDLDLNQQPDLRILFLVYSLPVNIPLILAGITGLFLSSRLSKWKIFLLTVTSPLLAAFLCGLLFFILRNWLLAKSPFLVETFAERLTIELGLLVVAGYNFIVLGLLVFGLYYLFSFLYRKIRK